MLFFGEQTKRNKQPPKKGDLEKKATILQFKGGFFILEVRVKNGDDDENGIESADPMRFILINFMEYKRILALSNFRI